MVWEDLKGIDNAVAFLSSASAGSVTGSVSIAGGGASSVPAQSNEIAILVACAVLTAGGEATANQPSGWTTAYNGSSTMSGMHCDVFTKLPGAVEPVVQVTYPASVTGYTLAGVLITPSGTAGTSIALDGMYSLKLTGT
jgi:hypothetical protein